MADLKQQDKRLWEKISDWFRNLAEKLQRLVDAYQGVKPDTAEGRMVADMQEVFGVLQSLYEDALADAGENFQRAEKNATHNGGKVKYSVSYRDAIDQLADGTLDRRTNTHLLVSENTPQVYIDKAGAKDQKIIMGWDIAYLAMNKNGDIPGNYHGLGREVMKNLPKALEDPLFIVKQNNGRVAAVTEIVVKKNRSVVVSVEFDAFKSTIQGGKTASDNYNIIVTAMDAKPNYLQNTILSGNIVHNKNNENPANFILRLKSLNKALPNDDLARSSKTSIRNEKPEVKEKFSDRDSDGNELSQEQQEYFKDSKVRDEQGRLLTMYHGTPNGGFTKFRSGTYFTQNPEYAEVYQNPGASSISAKKGAVAPMTYKVYLDIKKPFDTRNAKERRIFMQEFYRKYGTGTPLADSGLPDWVDGMDLQEFIEDMEYDYDGLILDEGGVGGYGDEVVSRGLSYVVFSSEQVKNVSNKTPTKDPDIQYSERNPESEKVNRFLEKENGKLREDITYLKELLKLQGSVTKGTKFTKSSVEAMASQLMKSNNVKGDRKELARLLNEVYEYIAKGEELRHGRALRRWYSLLWTG